MHEKLTSALVAFAAFWAMYGAFALLGGHFDLTLALLFAVMSISAAAFRAHRRRRRQTTPTTETSPSV